MLIGRNIARRWGSVKHPVSRFLAARPVELDLDEEDSQPG